MIVFGLDADFQTVKMMRYLNLQWNRRYYKAGSFVMQILMDEYDPAVKYLSTPERPELGLVQRFETQESVKGKFVLLSGLFAEGLLKRSVFYYRYKSTGLASNMARACVDIFCRNVPLSIVYDGDYGGSVDCDWIGDEVGPTLESMLQTQELSQSVRLDDTALKYKLWQGLDRTQAQSVNNFALFSDACMSAGSFSLIEDESDYKNYALVRYGEESVYDPQIEVDGRDDPTEAKRLLLINKTGSTAEEAEAMKQEAREQLQEHPRIRQIDIDVSQSGLVYRTDYDLGDKCDLVHAAMGKSYTARVTEINEVWKRGEHTVTCRFGEQTPTDYQKLRSRLRNMKGGR